MPGHRRISTDLYLDLVDRKKARTKPEALIELNLDDHAGTRKSVRSYARIWKWSREKVASLISLYEAHIEDLKNADSRGSSPGQRPATYRPQTGHPTGHEEGQESRADPGMLGDQPAGKPATQPATNRPLSLPETGHNLEPNQNRRGEGSPKSPSALSVGKAEARERNAARQVLKALERAGPCSPERQKTRRARLELFASMYLACGPEPSATQLLDRAQDTQSVPPEILPAAIRLARKRREERGNDYPPTSEEINNAASSVATQARKQRAQGGS